MYLNNRREETKTSVSGIGIGGLLGVAFIILKLCGVINWSWLWVLAPFWIPIALFLIFMLVGFFVLLLKD